MVTTGEVFKMAKSTQLSNIASKLKGSKTEEDNEESDSKFTLTT